MVPNNTHYRTPSDSALYTLKLKCTFNLTIALMRLYHADSQLTAANQSLSQKLIERW